VLPDETVSRFNRLRFEVKDEQPFVPREPAEAAPGRSHADPFDKEE